MTSDNHHSSAWWLDYLANRHIEPIQLGLERVRTVADLMGLCPLNAVVITVAGTNGKGSTVAALESIYCAAGYRVGAYTSPHLLNFHERICVNQRPISEEALCAAFCQLHTIPESLQLTYFEMTTLAAFIYFRTQPLDVIILEVGMGGRLDATNLVDADLAIITTIDLDHEAWLGKTRDAIGYEKAGILRSGQLAVYADMNPPLSVLTRAQALAVDVLCLGREYTLDISDSYLKVNLATQALCSLPRPLLNPQAVAAAVIATYSLRYKLPICEQDWSKGMRHVTIPGRQQLVHGSVTQVLDVAHNPQAVRCLASFLEAQVIKGRVHAVFSALRDKDILGLVRPMQHLVSAWYVGLLSGERAASEAQLKAALSEVSGQVRVTYCVDSIAAYHAAMACAIPGDWVVIYGSFLTVAAVLSVPLNKEKK